MYCNHKLSCTVKKLLGDTGVTDLDWPSLIRNATYLNDAF